jgi:hypothetical protein
MNENKVYGIQYKDGSYTKLAGKTIQEAYSQNGKKTLDGNVDFSIMDFYFRVPVPMTHETIADTFQLLIKENEKDDWQEIEKPTSDFKALDTLLSLKINLEGIFDGMIVNLKTENPVVWWKWEKKYA